MLEDLLASIQARHNWKFPDKLGELIYLGDYIDRGPNSKKAIDLAIQGLPNFSSIFLKGNHEKFLTDALASDERNVWNNWMSAGGEVTLKSFGYDLFHHKYDHFQLANVLGEQRVNWLKNLKLFYELEDMICVHAGLKPETSLLEQSEKDMLWIRNRFLESDFDFGKGIVHGHTPKNRPEVKRNRIGLDTGAGMGGSLTALVVDKPWKEILIDPTFISID